MRLFAVIPAAGRSTRLGRAKLALPIGGSTVIQRVIEGLKGAGVGPIVVVVAPHVPELVPLATAAGASVVALPAETPDMRATVEHGLAWIDERFSPSAEDAFLLVPGDCPALAPSVVRAVLDAAGRHPERSIIVPTHAGRRGHPTMVRWSHVPGIRAWAAHQGLDAYLRAQAGQTFELPVPSPEVLLDVDTWEDYERVRAHFGPQRGD